MLTYAYLTESLKSTVLIRPGDPKLLCTCVSGPCWMSCACRRLTMHACCQIRRKNIAVAAAKNGRMYSLLASARSDQYNKAKEELLQHIVESFRVRP